MTSDDPAPGGIGTRRSARSKRTTASSSGSSSSRAAKLAALREARQSGRGTLDMYEVDEGEVYDEVPEDEYQRLTRLHGEEDDFVEEDGDALLGLGHSGYTDHGQDVWAERYNEDSSEDGEEEKSGSSSFKRKRGKKGGAEDSEGKGTTRKGFTDFFQRNVASTLASVTANAKQTGSAMKGSSLNKNRRTEADDADFLENLLGELDAPAPSPTRSKPMKSFSTKAKASSSREPSKSGHPLLKKPRLPPASRSSSSISDTTPQLHLTSALHDAPISKPKAQEMDPEDDIGTGDTTDDWGDFGEMDDAMMLVEAAEEAEMSIKNKGTDDVKGKASIFDSKDEPSYVSWRQLEAPEVKHGMSEDSSLQGSMTLQASPSSTSIPTSASSSVLLEKDGTLRMFWMDAYERQGLVWLFGKVFHRESGQWMSTCVTIQGSLRNLYVLPQPAQYNEQGEEVKAGASALEVYNELRQLLPRHGIHQWQAKEVERTYAFEEAGIPAKATYLKVVYPFTMPSLPSDLRGASFTRVFGTESGALELLLLKRRLVGPCWISLSNPHIAAAPTISWCRIEVTIQSPKEQIRRLDDQEINHLPAVPPLTLASLVLRTVMDVGKRENVLVAAHLLVYESVDIMDPKSLEGTGGGKRSRYTVVRPMDTSLPFPPGLKEALKRESQWLGTGQAGGGWVEQVRTERALLSYLLSIIHRHDPDVLIGHNFFGFDLDVLMHRCKACNVEQWSRLGRLRRSQWPMSLMASGKGGKKRNQSQKVEKSVVGGRLVCDTYLTAKDLVKAHSYGMTSLAGQILGIGREEVVWEKIAQAWGNADSLASLLSHAACDAWIGIAMTGKLQVLPLTRQLTTLAGNLWSRTLTGARAERNEFLLLHEFHRGRQNGEKYILPDKLAWGAKASGGKGTEVIQGPEEEGTEGKGDEGGGGSDGVSSRRKPAYEGGLVLEPKRGLYDGYVVALDFNSLYPSIIQEYNICFTTVTRPGQAPRVPRRREGGSTTGETGENGEQDGGKGGEKTQREEEKEEEEMVDEIPGVPDSDAETGILPMVIRRLVGRRRAVKGMMKQPGLSDGERTQLDIRQKALKLTANSMYGCLGFSHSRFYAKPLARLITSKGREILEATVALAEAQGLEVVYGDTDSIMVHMRTEDVKEVRRLAGELKREVNKRYRELEIEMDALYRKMLLLRKKKYAALSVINLQTVGEEIGGGSGPRRVEEARMELETKGLDMVRRDWCDLSRDVSAHILNDIMGLDSKGEEGKGGEQEEMSGGGVIERIHTYLRRVGEETRKGWVPVEKYVITKSLTKAPQEYADARRQPHVLVARRMLERGMSAGVGETIPYIIVRDRQGGPGDRVSGSEVGHVAERAVHPNEYRQSHGEGKAYGMEVDVEWYLQQQIHPPISRLCEPLEGTDGARLAECLGLDPRKYQGMEGLRGSGTEGSGSQMMTLASQIPDVERFKDVRHIHITCPSCGVQRTIQGILGLEGSEGPGAGIFDRCTGCQAPLHPASLVLQVRLAIREEVRKHEEGWWRCEEQGACGRRTRRREGPSRQGPGGPRRMCGQDGCTGLLLPEYPDEALYTQLIYFDTLFNVERAMGQARLEALRPRLLALQAKHAQEIALLGRSVQAYLRLNRRKYVDLAKLFSFCRV
ncbi:MAG: DNA polymerase family B-domain-containing protein [Piptocephalis tieghemiana]|nr:MAG: DNA polymerase family B-domain-containing protein [Piptocephalis tieghemiana]